MIVVFDSYSNDEPVPVLKYLKNKKLLKYFNRETEAAIVGAGKINELKNFDPETPFYFALGLIEYEDYGLKKITVNSKDSNNKFSNKLFIEKGLSEISPLNQFKVLQNMPLSFVSINYNLCGDSAVLYSSASALLMQAMQAPLEGKILIGASKAYSNGNIEAGFALIKKDELENSEFINCQEEAVLMFRKWDQGENQ